MNLSLAVAVLLLVAKVTAAGLTGSSAIYSDAAESVVHVLAVAFAAWALRFAYKPSDDTHHYGHDKVAFISSGFEGAMISAAALLIVYEAARQAFAGGEISSLGTGMLLTAAAAVVNLVLGGALLRVGRKRDSAILRANGEHVLADVWTSAGVLAALVLCGDWRAVIGSGWCFAAIAWFPSVILEFFRRTKIDGALFSASLLSGIAGFDGFIRLVSQSPRVGC